MTQRVLVLGADGYCGWSAALHLSARGFELVASDNYVRRDVWDKYRLQDFALEVDGENAPLYPVKPAHERLATWAQVTGKTIQFVRTDLVDYPQVEALIDSVRPDAVVHFAEQRSAPFSNLSPQHALETLKNNTFSTYNLLEAISRVDPSIHLVKLGTMGEYGYTPQENFIEEGSIDFPKRPASPYHMTKCMDSIALEMMRRIYKLRVTDLHQGVVYGIRTDETATHPDLYNRFDYDGVWGTVINRFCAQALAGEPLSIYGAGGQSRGIISIQDSVRCIELALLNPPGPGEMAVRNQITEIRTVQEIAGEVMSACQALGLQAEAKSCYNPRLENEGHDLKVRFGGFVKLGLKPRTLRQTLVDSDLPFLIPFKDQVRRELLSNQTLADWRKRDA
jgi:UDP-sulfoquinovose synthase